MKKSPWTPRPNSPAVLCVGVSVKTPKFPPEGVGLATLGSHQTLSMDRFNAEAGGSPAIMNI